MQTDGRDAKSHGLNGGPWPQGTNGSLRLPGSAGQYGQQRLQRHRAIKSYLGSPIKGTPELEGPLCFLLRNGFSIEDLQFAYLMINLPVGGGPVLGPENRQSLLDRGATTEEAEELIRWRMEQRTGRQRRILQMQTGVSDEKFLDEMMSLIPAVPKPLGPASTFLPQVEIEPGERLLTNDDWMTDEHRKAAAAYSGERRSMDPRKRVQPMNVNEAPYRMEPRVIPRLALRFGPQEDQFGPAAHQAKPMRPPQPEDVFFDPHRADAAYMAALQTHLAVQNYLKSPARETEECQAILLLLQTYGLGINELKDAYWAAFEYSRFDIGSVPGRKITLNGEPFDPGNPDHVAKLDKMFAHQRDIFRLERTRRFTVGWKLPEQNAAKLLGDLLRIKPRVPYGDWNGHLRLLPGDRLYTPSDAGVFPPLF